MRLPSRPRPSGVRQKAVGSRSFDKRDDLLCAQTSILLFIDHQTRLLPSIDDCDRVLSDAAWLGEAARVLGVPVIGTEQMPEKIGPLHSDVRKFCSTVLSKVHFDACADGLVNAIRDHPKRTQIVISGCEAHVCVLQTAVTLLRAGFSVWIVSSSTGSHSQIDRALALERLQTLGAIVVSLEMVLFEWLARGDHPRFRDVLQMIKAHRSCGKQAKNYLRK
ncbi:Isochorismatase hydrolase [Hyphomicrobium sp. GJ21]|uniref:isochorismatase family protein n=1 Tax=Hyphomicrobium sp. GJ21 TaxID=113574 RepID=UPI000622BDFB|nr:isochorismatase family protein [Hyphomicrobium sp. GJ21]CEJ87714.1 Isochorismatase hydrolase [Hyphomicrobium sp. GJ21]